MLDADNHTTCEAISATTFQKLHEYNGHGLLLLVIVSCVIRSGDGGNSL